MSARQANELSKERIILLIRKMSVGVTVLAAMLATSAARAEEAEAEETFSFTGSVGIYSDYRFRGVSLSDRDVAPQGTVTATHNSTGIYAGFWTSSIEQLNGAEAEIDLYAGWAKEVGPVKLDVGATGYLYPGGDDINYYELYAKAGHSFGPLSTTLSFYYVPDQKNTLEDNYYINLAGGIGIPATPLTLNASIGYVRGAFDFSETFDDPDDNGKLDWSLGVSAAYKIFTLSVSYVDTNRALNIGRSGVVASLAASF